MKITNQVLHCVQLLLIHTCQVHCRCCGGGFGRWPQIFLMPSGNGVTGTIQLDPIVITLPPLDPPPTPAPIDIIINAIINNVSAPIDVVTDSPSTVSSFFARNNKYGRKKTKLSSSQKRKTYRLTVKAQNWKPEPIRKQVQPVLEPVVQQPVSKPVKTATSKAPHSSPKRSELIKKDEKQLLLQQPPLSRRKPIRYQVNTGRNNKNKTTALMNKKGSKR